jgi:hypothetical protein
VWQVDTTLNPEAVKLPKPKKNTKGDGGVNWTPEMFVEQFASPNPVLTAILVNKAATSSGMSEANAKRLLTQAAENGLLHKWKP